MNWFFYIAFKQLFPTGKGVSLFSCLAIVGVALGVWVLIVVLAVMAGFMAETSDKLIAVNGHIKVQGQGILYEHTEITAQVQAHNAVQAVSPYAEGIVMITAGDFKEYPVVRGFDSMNPEPAVSLESFIIEGAVEDLVDWTVIIGDKLAQQMKVVVGDTISLYTPLIIERLRHGEVLLPEELEVVGIFSTGYTTVDENSILVTLRKMQDLYALQDGIHGLMVRLQEDANMVAVVNDLNQSLMPAARAITWMDENSSIITAIKTHKAMMYFILLAISVVAAFSIAISLLTTVLRKTQEIGIYSALGGARRHIALVFALQGFLIGVVGTCLGLGCAVAFLHFRNEILGVFVNLTGSRDVLVQFYQFETLPLRYTASDFGLIIASAMIISTLAGLMPAWRALSLKPSEALRNG